MATLPSTAPRTFILRTVALAAAVLTLASCGSPSRPPSPSPSEQSQPGRYVHLGDSYAAGAGIEPLVADSDLMCLRSQRNFGELVAAQVRSTQPDFVDVSCAGASTESMFTAQFPGVPPQLDALTASTTLVTVMVGGNDDGVFGTAVSACSTAATTDPTGSPCAAANGDTFLTTVDTRTYPALRRVYAEISRRAPHARVLAVGYPRILPRAGGCYPTMRIAAGDIAYLNRAEDALNDAVRRAAEQSGAQYVDTSGPSAGHDACAALADRWIEPMAGARTRVTVHPNAAGQQGIAAAVEAALPR